MKKFKVEKLVRDKILDNILSNKLNKVDYKILDKKDFLISLKNKFIEEIDELNFEDKEDAIKELADLQLIIDTCLKTLNIKKTDFKKVANNKIQKIGRFDKKTYIKTVELDEGDGWFDYYLKKFEEIK